MKQVYVWNRAGALGDIICTMNLLKRFRKEHPNSTVLYLCIPQIADILKNLIFTVGFDGLITTKEAVEEMNPAVTIFEMVGYPTPRNKINPGNHPHGPMRKHLLEYFADDLGMVVDFNNFEMKRPKFPLKKNSFITLQTTAGWSPYKNWDTEKWNRLCYELQLLKIPVVQIGGPNDQKLPYAQTQIRGPDNCKVFDTCMAALANARLHVGVDSWGNHATNIKWYDGDSFLRQTPGIILWGSSQVTATGYDKNVNISKGLSCQPCFKEDPKISSEPLDRCRRPEDQTYAEPKHECMSSISVAEVKEKIVELWEENA